jgi:hypothetical protein
MSNLSFSKTLKILEISKEDLNELRGICGFGESEEFSESQIETLREVIQQRHQSGAESYAEAWTQLQAEVVPVEAQPVSKRTEADELIDQGEAQAQADYHRVRRKLGVYSDEVDTVVITAYLNKLNLLFKQQRVQQAILEEPDELTKKPGPLMSRLNERLAAQREQIALPASTTSSSGTSSVE